MHRCSNKGAVKNKDQLILTTRLVLIGRCPPQNFCTANKIFFWSVENCLVNVFVREMPLQYIPIIMGLVTWELLQKCIHDLRVQISDTRKLL